MSRAPGRMASGDAQAEHRPESRPRAARSPDKLMATALKILAARPRSESQLRERLVRRPWATPDMVERCIERLKEFGYVNDSLFAHSYASSRISTKPVGRARLARELAGKKVSQETINQALDTVFDAEAEERLIERAIEKRLRTHGRPADRAGLKRMFDHLARLGFQYDLISRKLRALHFDSEQEM